MTPRKPVNREKQRIEAELRRLADVPRQQILVAVLPLYDSRVAELKEKLKALESRH